MRCVLFGANSYIARNVIHFNKKEHYAELSLYGRAEKQLDGEPNYRTIHMDSVEELQEAVCGSDVILFFVGKTGTVQGFDEPELFLRVNELYLLNLLNACRTAAPNTKVVFLSSRLIYGGSNLPLEENADKKFLTPYAIQKFACEQYLEMYQRLYGISYCVLRLCVPYGTLVHPVKSYGTLSIFQQQAQENGEIVVYGDGSQLRTFTYIEDLCRIIWDAARSSLCVNDVFNVGGETLSIRSLAEKVAESYKAKVTELPWPELSKKIESGSTVFASEKLDRVLGTSYMMTIERWIDMQIKSVNMHGGGVGLCRIVLFSHDIYGDAANAYVESSCEWRDAA